ncbi:MAG: Holliday junction branch migration protein RuvA [Cryobacterium sp.]
MISSVRGPVLSALGSIVVVDVGGLGYAVQVVPATALACRIGQEVTLTTTLIVREDSLTLYGFSTADELAVFDLLIAVTGVGPKSALGVLAALTPQQIARAVALDDDAAFRKVSGIGPKTAKLIVLSLAGKIAVGIAAPEARPASTVSATVQTALIGLGWSEKIAAQAVEDTLAEQSEVEPAVAAVLRLALARLGPAQHPNTPVPAPQGRAS